MSLEAIAESVEERKYNIASNAISPRSPSGVRRALEHQIEISEKQQENEWTACCCPQKTDKRLLQFSAKLVISLVVLGVSLHELVTADPCDGLIPFWSSLVSFIIGLNTNNTNQKQKNKG